MLFIDRIKIDDPVGAVSVHAVNGAWGTLAAGLFNIGGTSVKMILVQLLGIGACFIWTFTLAFILFKILAATVGLRVSAEEEIEGLDIAEHGGEAYPDFGLSSSHTGSPSFASRPAASMSGLPIGAPAQQE